MKIKVLAVLGLAALVGVGGACRGGGANTANANMNTNTNMNTTVATPMPTMAMADPAAKSAVEDALKKKGITGVTVEATRDEVTLRGTVAKGKMTEAMMAATEAGKRKVVNQLTEGK